MRSHFSSADFNVYTILNICKPHFGFAIFPYGVSVLFLQILGFKFCCGVPLVNNGFLVAVRGLDMVLTYWTVSATANSRPKPQHRIPGYSPDCSLLPVEFAFQLLWSSISVFVNS